jgi:hypothetical protein
VNLVHGAVDPFGIGGHLVTEIVGDLRRRLRAVEQFELTIVHQVDVPVIIVVEHNAFTAYGDAAAHVAALERPEIGQVNFPVAVVVAHDGDLD